MLYIKNLWHHCHCATSHIYNATLVLQNKQIIDYNLPIAHKKQIYWVRSDHQGTILFPNIYPVNFNQYIQFSNTFIPLIPDYQIKFKKILNLKSFL